MELYGISDDSPPPANQPPRFTHCPEIEKIFYAEDGKITKKVEWKEPTAEDPEDDYIKLIFGYLYLMHKQGIGVEALDYIFFCLKTFLEI